MYQKSVWFLDSDRASLESYRENFGLVFKSKFLSQLRTLKKELNLAPPYQSAIPNLLVTEVNVSGHCILDWLANDGKGLLPCPFLVVAEAREPDLLRRSFEAGAKDYLCKPVKREELLVEMERFVGIEGSQSRSDGGAFSQIHFSAEAHSIWCDSSAPVFLTAKEVQIFSVLFRSPGRRATRKEICSQVWSSTIVSPRTFDVHLFNLRKKVWCLGIEIRFEHPDTYFLCPPSP